jgi:hypothetical protein
MPNESISASATLSQISLIELFEKDLAIPEYQRSYAWPAPLVRDLVKDLSSRDGSYLLGTIILHDKQSFHKFDIVDGQQRLVTLAILTNEMQIAGNSPLLQQHFSTSSKSAIKEAQRTIRNELALLDAAQAERLRNMLCQRMGGILFSVVTVEEDSLELAFSFFDSVNSKGVRLSDFDLLKAHHLMFIPADEEALAVRHNTDWQRNDDKHSIVFGTMLRRIRMWARGRSRDSWHERPDYDEFVAIVEPESSSGEEHQFSRYMQPTAFRSWRRENGRVVLSMDWPVDHAEALLPFEMTQTIEGGDSFFLFTQRYHSLHHSLFGSERSGRTTAFAFVGKLAGHIQNGHIQTAFCSLAMLYVDKFSDARLIESAVYLESILSRIRWDRDRVRIEGTLDYVLQNRLVAILMESANSRHACLQLEQLAKAVNTPTKESIGGVKWHYFHRLSEFYRSELGRIPSENAKSIARHYINTPA